MRRCWRWATTSGARFVPVGGVTVDADVTEDSYDISASLQSRGILNLFERTNLEARASGFIRNGDVHWARYDLDHRYSRKRRVVNMLVADDGAVLTQSLAIMEYLDDAGLGDTSLLPKDPVDRAHVRALALALACDVHPLNNVRVLNYLSGELGATNEQKNAWIAHWIAIGLDAFEKTLEQSGMSGHFCFDDMPTLADCVLVPQVFSARRFNVDVSKYPRVAAIDALCNTLPAFISAHPKNQPDFSP